MKTENIRFYHNGIKVNGGKLVKCLYSVDNNIDHSPSISIHCKDCYSDLPRDVFDVENDSDLYTDYFDDDHTTLTPEHPLYPYARAAALKGEIRSIERYLPYCDKRAAAGYHADFYKSKAEDRRAQLEKYRAELEALPAGHPTAADLAKVEEMQTARKNAERARRQAEDAERREAYLKQQNAGCAFVESNRAEYPPKAGAPHVVINWSESPYLASYEDGELDLSVAAAENVLKYFDEGKAAENAGYDKTSFTVYWTDEDGVGCQYDGRYDLGDGDGGLVQHIRGYGEFYINKGKFGNGNPTEEDIERGRAIVEVADMLAGYTAEGRIVSVDIPDGVITFANRVAELQQKRAAQRQQQTARNISDGAEDEDGDELDPFDAVQILTNEQIEDVIMRQKPDDNDYVARFFLQELFRRDEKLAMQVLKRWKSGE